MTFIFSYDDSLGYLIQTRQSEENVQEIAADSHVIYFFGEINASAFEELCVICGRPIEIVDVMGVPERLHKPTPDDLYQLLSCE